MSTTPSLFMIWLNWTISDKQWSLAETPAVTRTIRKRRFYHAYKSWCHQQEQQSSSEENQEIMSFETFCQECERVFPHLELYQLNTDDNYFRFGSLERVRKELRKEHKRIASTPNPVHLFGSNTSEHSGYYEATPYI